MANKDVIDLSVSKVYAQNSIIGKKIDVAKAGAVSNPV